MSPRMAIVDVADWHIFAAVRKRRYLKSRFIPSATWIRSSIAQISRCMRFMSAICWDRPVPMRLFLYPQSCYSLHFRQSTRAF